jgi:hypothetical protein
MIQLLLPDRHFYRQTFGLCNLSLDKGIDPFIWTANYNFILHVGVIKLNIS